jgi:hypothetical protein
MQLPENFWPLENRLRKAVLFRSLPTEFSSESSQNSVSSPELQIMPMPQRRFRYNFG